MGGFMRVNIPEAVPSELRDDYARQVTLKNKWLVLALPYLGGDISEVEFHTGSCEVRGIGRRDPYSIMNGSIMDVVKRYLPNEYDAFKESVHGNYHPPGNVGNMKRMYRPLTSASGEVQLLCEEAMRRWFIDSIDMAGGLDQPIAELFIAEG